MWRRSAETARSRRGASTIIDALRPWLEAARTRQQAQHVFRLWTSLGKRAHGLARLDALIADILWNGHKNHAAAAATLWLEDPKTRDLRVRDLVKRDASGLYLTAVLEHAHRRRQTLLAGRFAATAPRGRFHDGKVVWVPAFARGLQRWSTTTQEAYVALLRLAEAEPKHFTQTRAALVAMRATVPLTTTGDLADALGSSDVAVQEAALGALAGLDAPAASLPLLLGALDGDRARVAMYALPRLAMRVPRAPFVEAIAEVLGRERLKVTVHKEALRLLGWAATPRAVGLLEEAWRAPLHRDVRIAALHAARNVLSLPAAWKLIESAATHESPDVARAVVEVAPTAVAAPHRARYLAVMSAVVDHPSPAARGALFDALRSGWALADLERAVELAARVLGRGDLADPSASATLVLADGARGIAVHDAIVAVVAALVSASEVDVAPAGERDRLAHRRLRAVVDVLVRERHPSSRILAARLATELLARPTTFAEGARLRIAAASREALGEALLSLVTAAPSAGLAMAVERAAREVVAAGIDEWSADEAREVVSVAMAGGPLARVVVPALLALFGKRWGWGEVWTDPLARLRNDDDIDVRNAARAVWVGA